MVEWREKSLFSTARWKNGLAYRDIHFSKSGKPVIKIAELKSGVTGQTKFTQDEFDTDVLVRPGDMLFSWSGNPDTSIDVFYWYGPDGWLNQHIYKIFPVEDVDPQFLYFVLKSLKPTFSAIARDKQTTGLGHVTLQDFKRLSVRLPQALPEQRAIAGVLGALDDRIAASRRMAAVLEGMARAIFTDWFVDFGPTRAKMAGEAPYLAPEIWDLFPDRLDPATGLPEGWEMGKLEDVVLCVNDTLAPADLNADTPYVGLEHIERRSLALKNWGFASDVTSSKRAFKTGDLLFGKLRPYFHKVAMAPFDGICSTDILVIRPKRPTWAAFALATIYSENFVNYADQVSTGTRMPRSPWGALKRYRVYLPSAEIVKAFEATLSPMTRQLLLGVQQSQSLARMRDLLLTPLMSGRLRVATAPHPPEDDDGRTRP